MPSLFLPMILNLPALGGNLTGLDNCTTCAYRPSGRRKNSSKRQHKFIDAKLTKRRLVIAPPGVLKM